MGRGMPIDRYTPIAFLHIVLPTLIVSFRWSGDIPSFVALNDLSRDIGSAPRELEYCRRPALHWYVSGLMER